jgi:hypothetical protein
MRNITREEIKRIFKKVKHLRLPQKLEEINFSDLKYLGWVDESDDIAYLVSEYKGEISGLRCEITKTSNQRKIKGLCSICNQQKELNEIMLITTKMKRVPKGVDYRVGGVYICTDFKDCNLHLKSSDEIEKFFYTILER